MILGFSDIKTANGSKICPIKGKNVEKGDIIKKINKKSIKTIDELSKTVENSSGDVLDIEVLRNNEVINIS